MDFEKIFASRGKTDEQLLLSLLKKNGFKKNFKIINVVGTNGKGSVSNYISNALIDNGYKVGMFTSPHLISPTERIKVNDVQISPKDFEVIFKEIEPMINKIHFFSIMYYVAMRYFSMLDLDYVVLEAGIGGLRDITKLVKGDYGLITSIGSDHLNYFGTVDNVPRDKAGIANSKMQFFVPSSIDQKHIDTIKEVITDIGAKLTMIDNEANNYQEENKKLASGVYESIFNKPIEHFVIPDGRTQVIGNNGYTAIFDVAHNYYGVVKSLELMKQKGANFNRVVLSLNKSKDLIGILELFNVPVFTYQVDENFITSSSPISNIEEFYKNQSEDTLYIGSFYLIGKLLKLL